MQAPKGFQRKIPKSRAVNQLLKTEVFLNIFYKILRVFTITLIFSIIQINIKMKWFFVISLLFAQPAIGQQMPVLDERKRAELVDELLADRINNLLPGLMQNAGLDMWIIVSREYNEDPIIKTMLPSTWLAARRRTILVF